MPNLISLKCPECKSNITIEEGHNIAYCTYCGTKILIHNENEHKITYHEINDAAIKQSENEKIVKLKQLEMQETHSKNTGTLHKILTISWLVVSIILIVYVLQIWMKDETDAILMLFYLIAPVVGGGAYLIFFVIPEKSYEQNLIANNTGIRFPKDFDYLSGKDYEYIANSLRSIGFTNIQCVNLHDLTFGIFTKPGTIDTVTINDKPVKAGRIYPSNSNIVIKYHGK